MKTGRVSLKRTIKHSNKSLDSTEKRFEVYGNEVELLQTNALYIISFVIEGII